MVEEGFDTVFVLYAKPMTVTVSSVFSHRLRKKNVETPYSVQLSLLEGHIPVPSSHGSNKEQRQRGGQELAAVTVERWYMAPGVRRIEIRQNRVVGTLFLPPGFFLIFIVHIKSYLESSIIAQYILQRVFTQSIMTETFFPNAQSIWCSLLLPP